MNQDGLETTDLWDLRVIGVLVEPMGTKESVVMMGHLEQMEVAAREEQLENRESRVPVETEVRKEMQGSQDPVESRGGRAQLAPTETPVSPAGRGLPATEEMKAHLDQKDPKDREESKELQETEARWGGGEKMAWWETEQKAALVSRVILGPVETLVSRVVKELLDPKETTETLEIQAPITMSRDNQDLKEPKVTEDLRADRDLLGLLDHRELMNVRFWI